MPRRVPGANNGTNQTARYWILTIPYLDWTPPGNASITATGPAGSDGAPAVGHSAGLGNGLVWILGQREIGTGGFDHWQLVAGFDSPVRLSGVKRIFGNTTHAEPTRSAAAEKYVTKEDSAVPDTRIELGRKPFNRAVASDWNAIWESAVAGRLSAIPADVRYRRILLLCTAG